MGKINFSLLILILTFLTSCSHAQQLEKLGIIHSRGVDFNEQEGKVTVTMVLFSFDPESTQMTQTIEGSGKTVKGARREADFKTDFILTPGQMRLEMYGKETAEKGLFRYLNALVRDARLPDTMHLAISDTSAKEILSTESQKISKNIGQFLTTIIENEVSEGAIPVPTLHDFSRMVTLVGQDATLPVFSMKGEKPYLSGLALFQRDKYINTVSIEDSRLINIILNKVKNSSFELEIHNEELIHDLVKDAGTGERIYSKDGLALEFIILRGTSRTNLIDADNLAYKTDIDMKIELLEGSDYFRVKDAEIADRVVKELEKELEKKYKKIFNSMKEHKTDQFGLGKLYRALVDGDLDDEEWYDIYPGSSLEFNINLEINSFGTIR